MTLLPGEDLKAAFVAAVLELERRRDAINALNVFPVPDGDTGTNMLLTLRAAVENVPETPAVSDSGISVSDLFAGLAQGAFWGARGNSGVIFSQFLAGMAEALTSSSACSGGGLPGDSLERAFRLGADAAYRSVGNPVEGTMLTVLQSLAPAAAKRLEQGETDPMTLWEAAFDASSEALAKTPSQLPVLRDAGVVDAGGMGVVVILGAVLENLTGRVHLDPLPADNGSGLEFPGVITRGAENRAGQNHLDDSLATDWGYCIQFVIQTQAGEMVQALDPAKIREHLASAHSGSAVVAGGGSAVRIHVHAADPAPVLSYGASLGALHQITVDSMDHQNQRFVAEQGGEISETADVAVIAVVSGDGLSGLFLETGCTRVVSGGQTMNPSVQELLDSARASGAKRTILLPNNPNVVSAAEQASGGDPHIHVVASRSIPQGIAAILAFLPGLPLEENLASMEQAISSVRSIEVTQAVRSATIGGLPVKTGQYVALLDNDMSAVDGTPEGALRRALAASGLTRDGLVTVYVGVDGGWRLAEELANGLREEIEGIQVDLIYGGQPHYHYLASVE
ncbi:MAG: DAK2 domain-containing protein [Chloroflexi bacterium]|nr:DAK2 domain-containing protein [Chloroflexota bacterium]